MEILQQFGLLFLIIVAIAFIVKLLRQPIILGYVAAGVLFYYLYGTDMQLNNLLFFLSEMGIIFLLFLIGVEFDLKQLKYMGKEIFLATLLQSIVFFLIGYGLSLFFPFTVMERVHIGLLFMFSSTLLVAKWVEDKKETTSLHGKIILSTLIIQDLFAILAITFIGVAQEGSWVTIALAPLYGIALGVFAFIFSRYILDTLLKIATRYPELLFIFSLAICFLFMMLAELVGYTATIGAFIGGVILGTSAFKTDVYGRMKPLIIFFNMLFFVGLGFQLRITPSVDLFAFLGIFLAATLLLKPLIFYFTFRIVHYDQKTSWLAAISLSQASEFGIIIIAGSIMQGLISIGLGSIAVLAVLSTMILSSYLIKYDRVILAKVSPFFKQFDSWFGIKEHKIEDITINAQIVVFGYDEFSKEMLERLQQKGKQIMVIENDAEKIACLKRDNIPYLFNTVHSAEFFDHVHFSKPELCISNLVDLADNKTIIKEMKQRYEKIMVIVTAKNLTESIELYNANADYVIYPTYINQQHLSVLIEDYTTNIEKIIEKKLHDQERFKEQDAIKLKNKTFFEDIDTFLQSMTKTQPTMIERKPRKVTQFFFDIDFLTKHQHGHQYQEKKKAPEQKSPVEKKKENQER
ncbi:MAG: cation:proton antiporter [Candidatus Woesearchaeota archaeon]